MDLTEHFYNIFETLVILPFPAWMMAIMYLAPYRDLTTENAFSAIAFMFFTTSVVVVAKPPTRYLTNLSLCVELSALSMVLIVRDYYLPSDNRIHGEQIGVIARIWIMTYVTSHALIYTLLSSRGVSHVQMGCLGTVSARIGVICDIVFEALVEMSEKLLEVLMQLFEALVQVFEALLQVFEGLVQAFEGLVKAFGEFAKAFEGSEQERLGRGTGPPNSPPVINNTVCPPPYPLFSSESLDDYHVDLREHKFDVEHGVACFETDRV